MHTNFHLSYCGFQFEGKKDLDRRDCEMFIQQRNQGLRPNVDYIFQPMMGGWQVSGITPMGARAVCSIAQGMKFIPNRLDVTMGVVDAMDHYFSYESYYSKLVQWFSTNKPKLNISEMAPIGNDKRVLFGSKNSRWCLWLSEKTDPIQPFGGYELHITWTVRNENCLALWQYLVIPGNDYQFEEQCKEGFAACTNSLLGPDFFGVGLPEKAFLLKEKKAAENKDWYTYLSTVAGKIVTHYLNTPGANIDNDLAFLDKEIAARASKIFESKV